MCGSMVDIQSPTAEIRRGKRRRRRRNHCKNIMSASATQGGHNESAIQQLLLQPFYNPLSRTTRVSRYQKEHSPTHLCWSSTILYQLLPSTTIHSILSVQLMCLTIFMHNLCPSRFWSTSWSGALNLIFHTFLHPVSVFFSQHMPILLQIILSVPSLSPGFR